MLTKCWQDADNMLTRCWQDADMMLIRCWQNADKILTRCWQDAGKMLTRCWEDADNMLTRCWQDADNILRRCWQDADNMLTRCWQDADNMLTRCWQDADKMLTRCWQNADKSVDIFMVSWFIYENRADVGTFKKNWKFWRICCVIKLKTNKFCKIICIFFQIFIGRLVSSESLVVLKPLIYFKTAFLLMQEKLKFETLRRKRLMEIILGWF